MTKILACALVLLPALPAFATGRTLAVTTVVKAGIEKLKPGESQITVRTPRNTKVSQWTAGDSYVALPSKLNAAQTKRLYRLGPGDYFASSQFDDLFTIKK
jgi:hypothetical protein